MRLGTRLLLPLLATVVAVMIAFAFWAQQQRERMATAEARREIRAYASALGGALEGAFADPDLRDVQALIDRISREPAVYGVRIYGPAGDPLFRAGEVAALPDEPPEVVLRTLRGRAPVELPATSDRESVYAVIRPILAVDGSVAGALEVLQPPGPLAAERARIRRRFLLNTLALLTALSVLILWLVSRLVARPLDRMAAAAARVGAGELSYRVPARGAHGELRVLADEFNRMAAQLEGARAELVRESEERLALERRLRESEKLAAVGNLAAGLAHEIAAPLHVIQGRAEMLRRKPDGGGEPGGGDRHLGIIVDQIRRITGIVRSLLDYSRRREPRLEPVDLGDVVDDVVAFLEPELARAGVRVEREGPAELPVLGDAGMLHQVLLNLLLNAAHAAHETPGDRLIRVTGHAAPPGGRTVVRLDVADSGPGVPADLRGRIFEPMFTTKPEGAGSGFGLAVARSIAEEHGGTLELASDAPGPGGAVFRRELPAPPTDG